MRTCRCPICGAKNAGRAGAKSFGTRLVGRDEHGSSEVGRDRRKERRLRRRREGRAWRKALRSARRYNDR
jgi:hypothetical protein